MCGRFALYSPAVMVRNHYNLSEEVIINPRYNIAPGQLISTIHAGSSGGITHSLKLWGLIPHWAKDKKIGSKLINARSETLTEKPSFKRSFAQSRCLIPADGFFEWQRAAGQKSKKPFYIHRKDNQLLSFAGLLSRWVNRANGEIIKSCTIITTQPNDLVGQIHNRMPVIVSRDNYGEWLDPKSNLSRLAQLFAPCDSGIITCYPVVSLVNSIRNDSPDCIEKAVAE